MPPHTRLRRTTRCAGTPGGVRIRRVSAMTTTRAASFCRPCSIFSLSIPVTRRNSMSITATDCSSVKPNRCRGARPAASGSEAAELGRVSCAHRSLRRRWPVDLRLVPRFDARGEFGIPAGHHRQRATTAPPLPLSAAASQTAFRAQDTCVSSRRTGGARCLLPTQLRALAVSPVLNLLPEALIRRRGWVKTSGSFTVCTTPQAAHRFRGRRTRRVPSPSACRSSKRRGRRVRRRRPALRRRIR
jgi:hypothetical protein